MLASFSDWGRLFRRSFFNDKDNGDEEREEEEKEMFLSF